MCVREAGLATCSLRRCPDLTRGFFLLTRHVGWWWALVQTLGYCGRIWSHFDRQAIGGFIVQAILILIAPALYAASIYMILGRLISAVGAEHLSPVPLQWLTKIFVAADVVSFLLQAGGGGIQAGGTLHLLQIGEKIIIAGLFVQIAFFGFFVMTAVQFHRRLLVHASRPLSLSSTGSRTTVPWKKHLYVLYTVSSIILIRSIFRVVEYLQGNSGYLISHELFLYIFDTLLMVLVMVIFLIFYIDDLYLGLTSERSGDEEKAK